MNAQKLGKPLVAAITTVVLAGGAVNAQAQVIVDGCVAIELEGGLYFRRSGNFTLAQGDTVEFSAAAPTQGGTPTGVSLTVDSGTPIVENNFPGTVSFVAPAGQSYFLDWQTEPVGDTRSATWTITCTEGSGPRPTTTTTSSTTAATTSSTTAATTSSTTAATTSSTVAPTTTTAVSATTTAIPALGAFGIPLLAGIMAVIGMLGFSRRR